MEEIIKALETILNIAMNDIQELRNKTDISYATSLANLLADEMQRQFNDIMTEEIVENGRY